MDSDITDICLRRRGQKTGKARPRPTGRVKEPVSRAAVLLILAIALTPFAIFAVIQREPLMQWVQADTPEVTDPALKPMEHFLERYGVETARINRVARALVASGHKYKVDPKLLGSILIVESRGDPHAISSAHAVGIMQIHIPTWGTEADDQDINLFKIEDNIDMGARILRGYVAEHGLWDGVMRYHGWIASEAGSLETAQMYANMVRQLFES